MTEIIEHDKYVPMDDNEEQTRFVDISEIQRLYLPLSKKRIRKIVRLYLRTIQVGNKILVERRQLEEFLSNPDREYIQ